jgi:hypothetical protein
VLPASVPIATSLADLEGVESAPRAGGCQARYWLHTGIGLRRAPSAGLQNSLVAGEHR